MFSISYAILKLLIVVKRRGDVVSVTRPCKVTTYIYIGLVSVITVNGAHASTSSEVSGSIHQPAFRVPTLSLEQMMSCLVTEARISPGCIRYI